MKRNFLLAAAAAVLSLAAACTSDEGTADVTLSASPASVTIPAEGGTVPVVIATNLESFEYSGAANWLAVTVDGKSLGFTAEANVDQEERSCIVTVTAGDKSVDITVTQEAASKYPGYEAAESLDEAVYIGTMYQNFGQTSGEGGAAQIYLNLDARNRLVLEFFTEAFASADEVILPDGTYTLAEKPSDGMMFSAEPMTFSEGIATVYDEGTEDEEILYMGSYIETTIGDAQTVDLVTGGTFTVESGADGTKVIKMDFTTESGESLKYYYEGQLELDATSAVYPTGEVEPTDVISVTGAYNGAADDAGSLCNIELTLMTEAMVTPSTTIDFNMTYEDFSEDMDLSGTYEAVASPYTAVGINKGVLEESEGSSLPSGTYVYLSLDMSTFVAEYFVADGESVMTLTKNADGTYDITASLKNAAGESYDYYIEGMDIQLSDWSETGDEEW